MTLNLSNDWRNQKKINTGLIILFALLGLWLIINGKSETVNLIMLDILVVLIPIICILYLQKTINPIIKKIEFAEEAIVMFSRKNRSVSVDLSNCVYYEILRLRVGKYTSKEFIILSNNEFESLSQIAGLGKICKMIDKDYTKIIAPYNEEIIPWLKLDVWTEVNGNLNNYNQSVDS